MAENGSWHKPDGCGEAMKLSEKQLLLGLAEEMILLIRSKMSEIEDLHPSESAMSLATFRERLSAIEELTEQVRAEMTEDRGPDPIDEMNERRGKEMNSYATKLIDLTERHAEEIATQWFKNVQKNPKTPSFQKVPAEIAIPRAAVLYTNMRVMHYHSENIFELAKKIFGKYTDELYAEGVPLHEAIYAIILMRRQLWLFAEFQALFITPLQHYQAIESLNSTILIFDYAIYLIAERYYKLMSDRLQKTEGQKKSARG